MTIPTYLEAAKAAAEKAAAKSADKAAAVKVVSEIDAPGTAANYVEGQLLCGDLPRPPEDHLAALGSSADDARSGALPRPPERVTPSGELRCHEAAHLFALALQDAIDVDAKVVPVDVVSVRAIERANAAADLFVQALDTYRERATPPLKLSPEEDAATHRSIHEIVQVLEGGGSLALDETFLERYQDCLYDRAVVEQDSHLHCTLMQRIEECSRWRSSLSTLIKPKRKRNRRMKRS